MDTLDKGTKRCSYCGEDIAADMRRCPYCGSLLDTKNDEYFINQGINISTPVYNEEQEAEAGLEAVSQNENMEGEEDTGDVLDSDVPRYGAGPAAGTVRSQIPFNTPVVNTQKKTLSNGMKVFLTALYTIIPGLGQLAGIITAIVFINSDDNEDKRSFGTALLVSSLIVFVITCVFYFVLGLGFASVTGR